MKGITRMVITKLRKPKIQEHKWISTTTKQDGQNKRWSPTPILFHHETLDGHNKFRVHNHQSYDGQ